MIATTPYDAVETRNDFDHRSSTVGTVEVSYEIAADDDIAIIDLRELSDYRQGHVPGALNFPKNEWDILTALRKDVVNILYGYSQNCSLAGEACSHFAKQGYRVKEMDGGFAAWKDDGLPVEESKLNMARRGARGSKHAVSIK